MSKTIPYILAVVVALTAVAYFSLTNYRMLNPDDEGYLLYNCEKTAEGQVPHRDFYDDYGPAVYWLGGSLFRIFGTKLIVIRIFVLALKTAMALLIFLIARKLLPSAFAALAALFFILTWGDPYFPAFNILYAGFVSHFLALLGLVFMIAYIEKDNRRWLVGTAVCLGLSALFKFHSAAFDFIGFSVFLSLKEGAVGLGADAAVSPSEVGATAQSRLMRLGKLLGAPVVAIFYLGLFARDHLDLYYFFIFLLPYFLLLGHVFASDVRLMRGAAQAPNNLRNCYFEILTLAGGVLAFISLTLLYYYRVGGLEELIYDTFALPMAMRFFKPMEDYRLHAGMIAAAVALISVLAWMAVRFRERSQTTREIFWAICLFLVLLAPTILILNDISMETWHKRAIYLLSPITLMICAYLLMSTWRKERLAGRNTRETLVLALLFIFACQGYMTSFPRTDPAHIQIGSGVIYILVSLLLFKVYAEWGAVGPARGKARGAILAVACAALLAFPFIRNMHRFYVFSPELETRLKIKLPPEVLRDLEMGSLAAYPEATFDFPRSAGLKFPMWPTDPFHTFVFDQAGDAIRFIRDNTTSDDRIFVMCEIQIMYFLAERDNFLQKENYFVFLAVARLIDKADRVRLSDEELTQRLAEERPRFVIRVLEDFGDQTQRIADIWPNAAGYIDDNYEEETRFGVYEVLRSREFLPAHTPRK